MQVRNGLTRRHVLEIGTAGAIALGQTSRIEAQTVKRIERFDPDLDKVISIAEPIQELMDGGGVGWAEGPLWWKEGGYLLFSDVRFGKRMKYTPGQGVTVAQEETNEGAGLTRDVQGRLVVCERATRRVVRFESDSKRTVLCDNYQGKRLFQPHDVVVKSDGGIYFTDPNLDNINSPDAVPKPGVYRVAPDLGSVTLLLDSLAAPTGLAFSPDESMLYVVSGGGNIKAFNVQPDGILAKASERGLVNLQGIDPGGPDGIKIDLAGNLYSGGAGGIWIVDPNGKKLGRITHGAANTTNIAFGGPDFKTLYFTSSPGVLLNLAPPNLPSGTRGSRLGSVNVKIAGVPVPPQSLRRDSVR